MSISTWQQVMADRAADRQTVLDEAKPIASEVEGDTGITVSNTPGETPDIYPHELAPNLQHLFFNIADGIVWIYAEDPAALPARDRVYRWFELTSTTAGPQPIVRGILTTAGTGSGEITWAGVEASAGTLTAGQMFIVGPDLGGTVVPSAPASIAGQTVHAGDFIRANGAGGFDIVPAPSGVPEGANTDDVLVATQAGVPLPVWRREWQIREWTQLTDWKAGEMVWRPGAGATDPLQVYRAMVDVDSTLTTGAPVNAPELEPLSWTPVGGSGSASISLWDPLDSYSDGDVAAMNEGGLLRLWRADGDIAAGESAPNAPIPHPGWMEVRSHERVEVVTTSGEMPPRRFDASSAMMIVAGQPRPATPADGDVLLEASESPPGSGEWATEVFVYGGGDWNTIGAVLATDGTLGPGTSPATLVQSGAATMLNRVVGPNDTLPALSTAVVLSLTGEIQLWTPGLQIGNGFSVAPLAPSVVPNLGTAPVEGDIVVNESDNDAWVFGESPRGSDNWQWLPLQAPAARPTLPFDPTVDYVQGDLVLVAGETPQDPYTMWRAERAVAQGGDTPSESQLDPAIGQYTVIDAGPPNAGNGEVFVNTTTNITEFGDDDKGGNNNRDALMALLPGNHIRLRVPGTSQWWDIEVTGNPIHQGHHVEIPSVATPHGAPITAGADVGLQLPTTNPAWVNIASRTSPGASAWANNVSYQPGDLVLINNAGSWAMFRADTAILAGNPAPEQPGAPQAWTRVGRSVHWHDSDATIQNVSGALGDMAVIHNDAANPDMDGNVYVRESGGVGNPPVWHLIGTLNQKSSNVIVDRNGGAVPYGTENVVGNWTVTAATPGSGELLISGANVVVHPVDQGGTDHHVEMMAWPAGTAIQVNGVGGIDFVATLGDRPRQAGANIILPTVNQGTPGAPPGAGDVVTFSSVVPREGKEGDEFVNTADMLSWVHDGTTWVERAHPSADLRPVVTVGSTGENPQTHHPAALAAGGALPVAWSNTEATRLQGLAIDFIEIQQLGWDVTAIYHKYTPTTHEAHTVAALPNALAGGVLSGAPVTSHVGHVVHSSVLLSGGPNTVSLRDNGDGTLSMLRGNSDSQMQPGPDAAEIAGGVPSYVPPVGVPHPNRDDVFIVPGESVWHYAVDATGAGSWVEDDRIGLPHNPAPQQVLQTDLNGKPVWVAAPPLAVMIGVVADTNTDPHQYKWEDLDATKLADFQVGGYLIIDHLPGSNKIPASVPGIGDEVAAVGDWVVAIDSDADGVSDTFHLTRHDTRTGLPPTVGFHTHDRLTIANPSNGQLGWESPSTQVLHNWAVRVGNNGESRTLTVPDGFRTAKFQISARDVSLLIYAKGKVEIASVKLKHEGTTTWTSTSMNANEYKTLINGTNSTVKGRHHFVGHMIKDGNTCLMTYDYMFYSGTRDSWWDMDGDYYKISGNIIYEGFGIGFGTFTQEPGYWTGKVIGFR